MARTLDPLGVRSGVHCTSITMTVFVFLLFIGVVLVGLFQPVVCQDLGNSQTFSRVQPNHALDYLLGVVTELHWESEIAFENQFMQVLQVLCLEGHGAAEHGVKENTKGPNVNEKPLVTLVYDDLWSQVGRCATLLLDYLSLLEDF